MPGEDEVRELLENHMKVLRRLLSLPREEVQRENAEALMRDFSARYFSLESMHREGKTGEQGSALADMTEQILQLSCRLLAIKSEEFGIKISLTSTRMFETDDPLGEGGAAVLAPLTPVPSPRAGSDAKPIPPTDEMNRYAI